MPKRHSALVMEASMYSRVVVSRAPSRRASSLKAMIALSGVLSGEGEGGRGLEYEWRESR